MWSWLKLAVEESRIEVRGSSVMRDATVECVCVKSTKFC